MFKKNILNISFMMILLMMGVGCHHANLYKNDYSFETKSFLEDKIFVDLPIFIEKYDDVALYSNIIFAIRASKFNRFRALALFIQYPCCLA